MSTIVPYPEVACIRCGFDGTDGLWWGVRTMGKLLGPYCDPCSKHVAHSSEGYQALIDRAMSRELERGS